MRYDGARFIFFFCYCFYRNPIIKFWTILNRLQSFKLIKRMPSNHFDFVCSICIFLSYYIQHATVIEYGNLEWYGAFFVRNYNFKLIFIQTTTNLILVVEFVFFLIWVYNALKMAFLATFFRSIKTIFSTRNFFLELNQNYFKCLLIKKLSVFFFSGIFSPISFDYVVFYSLNFYFSIISNAK